MALTLSRTTAYVSGNKRVRVYDVTFDNSYPTGGESLTASDVGLNKIESVSGDQSAWNGTLAVLLKYDYTNAKLLAFKSNTAANPQEVGDTASLASYVARLVFSGY